MQLEELYTQFAASSAFVSVKDCNGDIQIGTAFHIGRGVFVTARHVVEEREILTVATTARAEVIVQYPNGDSGGPLSLIHRIDPRRFRICEGPFYHDDARVDVAAFRIEKADPYLPSVPLGSQLDVEIDDTSFVLSEVLILGYPPIPLTLQPRLVAMRGEVNCVIDKRDSPYANFIVSGTARGGFSGGVVISEYGFALGLVTESLVWGDKPTETGFMNVLSIEPILECVGKHFDLPQELAAWAWAIETLARAKFVKQDIASLNPRLASASFTIYDDEHDVYCEIHCKEAEVLQEVFERINDLTPFRIEPEMSGPGVIMALPTDNPSRELLGHVVELASKVFLDAGFLRSSGRD